MELNGRIRVSRRVIVSLGAATALSCSRQREEETPIARAVSRSCAFELSPVGLCVCVCV